MDDLSARPADIALATQIVHAAVPLISAGFAELVDQLRAESALADLRTRGLASTDIIATVLTGPFASEYRKANQELVTGGEQQAGQLIREILTRERPQDGSKGEETGMMDSAGGRWWLDDPVDGTASMVKTAIALALGQQLPAPVPSFAITLALVEQGVPLLGVVAELRAVQDSARPGTAGLRAARTIVGYRTPAGYATTLDGEPMTSAAGTSGPVALMTTAPEVMFRNTAGNRDPVLEAGYAELLRTLGQSAPVVDQNIVGILATADGNSVAYERNLTAEDIGAAGPILAGLGAVLTEPDGQPLRFDDLTREYAVVAGRPALHRRAVAAIQAGQARPSQAPVTYFDDLLAASRVTGHARKSFTSPAPK